MLHLLHAVCCQGDSHQRLAVLAWYAVPTPKAGPATLLLGLQRALLRCCCCCRRSQVLHLVDFDQLKIENQQYLERIDAKNKELLQLKLSTGKTVQVRCGCMHGPGQQLWCLAWHHTCTDNS